MSLPVRLGRIIRSRFSRRRFLRSAAASLAASCVTPLARASPARQPDPQGNVIGFSQAGEPLETFHLGRGARRVLIIGGQHGGPEANTVALARQIISFFLNWPGEVPRRLALDVMPVANPDGLKAGVRQYVSGVDPNRNWDTEDWQADAYTAVGGRAGLGGPRPFSEQETRALADWVLRRRPALVINYHSAGGFVLGDPYGVSGELTAVYAGASEYWWPAPDVNPFSYPITGSMDDWLSRMGIPNIFVELTTYDDVELERNVTALRTVLAHLAEARPMLPTPGPR
jgi:hypothetical protein